MAVWAVLLIVAALTRRWRLGPLHPADIVLTLALIIACLQWLRGKFAVRPFQTRGMAHLEWAVVALAGLALMGSADLTAGVLDVVKITTVMLFAVLFFFNVAELHERTLSRAIALSTVALCAVALAQYELKVPAVNVAGLLDNRTLYGACLAAGTPFMLMELSAVKGARSKAVAAALFVGMAVISLLSLPMLAIFSAAALASAYFAGLLRPAALGLVISVALIATHALPREHSTELLYSVSISDGEGHVRRNAIELSAAIRAIAARPLLGHGPAGYQHTVSSAQFRGTLPPPAENRVEAGTQSGYLVMAVECGLPAAVLFALVLLAAAGVALDPTHGPSDPTPNPSPLTGRGAGATAAGLSALTLAASSLFTVTLINGPGFLLAAVLGICAAQRRDSVGLGGRGGPPYLAAGFARKARAAWRTWLARAAGAAACIALGLLLHAPKNSQNDDSYSDMTACDLTGAGRTVLVVDAADSTLIVPPMRTKQRHDATNGRCIGIDEGAGKPPKVEGRAVYSLDVAQLGRYRVWVRAWWSDGCANSVAAGVDSAPPYLIGNDGTYARWHWVRGPVLELTPGKHVLTLLEREDNIELDQLALANDDAFLPSGALESPHPQSEPTPATPAAPQIVALAEKYGSASKHLDDGPDSLPPLPPASESSVKTPPPAVQPAPEPATRPPERQSPAVPVEKPRAGPAFVVGIAGAYRDGFEDHLVSLGIPYVRLRDNQLENIDELKDIDVLMTSGSRCDCAAFMNTLTAFLKSGRTAIVEHLPEDYSAQYDPTALIPPQPYRNRFGDATLLSDGSKFFKGLPESTPYPADVNCNLIPLRMNTPDTAVYGALSRYGGRKESGALMVRTVGKGKLYFMALPAAFSAMWRGRKMDPYFINILHDALGPMGEFPFENFQYAPRQNTVVNMSDDFMRSPGQSGGWKAQSGSFQLSGQNSNQRLTFTVHATGDAVARTGASVWKDYRAAASVLLRAGDAGVWQSAADGSRLELRLSDGGRSVALIRRAGNDVKVLAQESVPDYPNGWRRVALFRREGVTQGFVDGEPVLRVKDAPEVAGPCGICANGDAYFDDFSAIDTAALTPARDTAPGEEGSERCLVRYFQRCSEKMSVYSPLWMLRPWPSDRDFVQVMLPLYTGGALAVDDRPPQPIPVGDELPLVKLPGLPQFDAAVHTSTWRDYQFAGQVTDWYTTSGDWMQVNRWSCNQEYEWYGGVSNADAVLWHKHPAHGSVAMEVLMAPRADTTYNEEQGHDLNLVIYGNGRNLNDGYLFTVLSAGRGCLVSKHGRVLGSASAPGLAQGGHTLHHSWFSVLATVSHGKIRFYFDRRLVVECKDDAPLNEGKLGIWTRQNKISVARATISYGE